LVDFSAKWCAPCRTQRRIVDRLLAQYRGKVSILILDVDASQELAMSFDITSIPTVSLFKDGIEIKRFVGLQSEDTLIEAVDDLLGSSKSESSSS
jgi:thioredoxin 1